MKIIPSNPAQTARWLMSACPLRPKLGMVLGTGFGQLVESLRITKRIPYHDIPGFPTPTVSGHAGELLFGHLGQTPMLLLNGRVHYYEGRTMEEVTFATRVLAAYGISDLVLTNAAGAINPRFRPGNLMLITDHINFIGLNPLRGHRIPGQSPFIDMCETYHRGLRQLLLLAAKATRVKMRSGTYLAVSGPSYETPAEVRAFGRLGADAVGMSTVPEALVARQLGMRLVGLSCLTNMAAGINAETLSHADVLATANQFKQNYAKLITKFAELYRLQSSVAVAKKSPGKKASAKKLK